MSWQLERQIEILQKQLADTEDEAEQQDLINAIADIHREVEEENEWREAGRVRGWV